MDEDVSGVVNNLSSVMKTKFKELFWNETLEKDIREDEVAQN